MLVEGNELLWESLNSNLISLQNRVLHESRDVALQMPAEGSVLSPASPLLSPSGHTFKDSVEKQGWQRCAFSSCREYVSALTAHDSKHLVHIWDVGGGLKAVLEGGALPPLARNFRTENPFAPDLPPSLGQNYRPAITRWVIAYQFQSLKRKNVCRFPFPLHFGSLAYFIEPLRPSPGHSTISFKNISQREDFRSMSYWHALDGIHEHSPRLACLCQTADGLLFLGMKG